MSVTIKIAGTVSNANAPIITSTKTQLAALATLRAWFQADAASAILAAGNKVSTLITLKGGSTTYVAQATDSKRPILTDAMISSYPAMLMAGGSVVMPYAGSAAYFVAAHTQAIVFYIDPTAGAASVQEIFSSFVDSTHQTSIFRDNISGELKIWNGGQAQTLGVCSLGVWHCVMIAADGVHAFRGKLDAGPWVYTWTDNNSGSVDAVWGAQGPSGGTAALTGYLSDMFDFSADLSSPSHAAELLLLQKFVSNTYGIAM